MKKIISTLALVLLVSTTAFSQVDKEYPKVFYEFLEVSGNHNAADEALNSMIEALKPLYPNIKESEWEVILRDVVKELTDEYIEMLIPIYQNYISKTDLEEIIRFYKTPVGQKYSKSQALMMIESLDIARDWSEKAVEQFMEALNKANQ